MDTDQYRFTLEDFSPTRRRKPCIDEPIVTGYIRWLRRHLLGMLPPMRTERDFCMYCEWWEDLIGDEIIAQRERDDFLHAVFDRESTQNDKSGEGGDSCARSEYVFPSKTGAFTISTWSDHLLATGDPDPYMEWEELPKGEPEPSPVRFHQLAALMAWCDLGKAVNVLVQSSVPGTDPGKRLRGKRQAETLVIGAAELADRAERHLAASRAVERRGPAAAEPLQPQRGESAPVAALSEPHDAEIFWDDICSRAHFRVTFRGETKSIPAVKNSGRVMRGLYYIYHILDQPSNIPVHVYTLDCSYQTTLARHVTAEPDRAKAVAAQAALAGGELHETTQVGSNPNSEHLRELEKLLEETNAARERGDEEAVERLKREAQEVHDKIMKQEEKNDRGAAPTASDRLKRAASRNVGKALKRAIKHVKKHFEDFGKHLDSCLSQKLSGYVIYSPREKITWLVRRASEDAPPS